MNYYFTCSIQKNKKGLPNKDENTNIKINEIKSYRSGCFLLQKFKNKNLFIAISNYYKHRTFFTEEICKIAEVKSNELQNIKCDNELISSKMIRKPESVIYYNLLGKGVDKNN